MALVFKCMACGKELKSGFINAPKLFCDKKCSNYGTKHLPRSVRAEELERRRLALKGRAAVNDEELDTSPCNDGRGIIVRCVICGKEVEQRTASPKIYCSEYCYNEQRRTHKVPSYVLGAESQKRRAAYLASLSPERRAELEYGRKKRGEFQEREAARLSLSDAPQPTRHCHNFYTKIKCQNMTWDYYCPDCRRKRRMGYVEQDYEETEDIWDDFSVPGSAE